jgi:hypothetical protein
MQIVKYSWKHDSGGFEPFFTLSDGTKIRLIDSNIHMEIGDKSCIGYMREGRRHECRLSARLDYGYICNECRMEDDFFNCMQCTGKECINPRQRDACTENSYFIYLAAFDSLLKVGISFEKRLLERLIEQGADFGVKIASVMDGKEARTIEQDMRKHLSIVDKVLFREKHESIFSDPNSCMSSISRALSRLRNNGFNKYLVRPEIYDLRCHYRIDRVASKPEVVEPSPGMRVDGDIIAAKGNIFIYREGGRLFATNAHRFIGRTVKIDEYCEMTQ